MIEFSPLQKNPTVAILYLTFNRLYYTRETLPALLDSSDTSFSIIIVDNGSTDGTVEYLKELAHPNIEQIIFNKRNQGLVKPTKQFWKESNAEIVGKIDNDILVPKGWIDKLMDAHIKIPHLGAAGFCHFRQEDFNPDIVRCHLRFENGIYFREQPWIGGNYLMKRDTVIRHNEYRQSRKLLQKRILYGFNKYQEKLAAKGYLNGYICNNEKELYLWEHLDDPRHPLFHEDKEYSKIRDMSPENIIDWYKRDAKQLLEESGL